MVQMSITINRVISILVAIAIIIVISITLVVFFHFISKVKVYRISKDNLPEMY